MDSAHHGVAGVWIEDGSGRPYGERTRTDSTGAFNLIVDNIHGVIFLYSGKQGPYGGNPGLGGWIKDELITKVKNCVAAPVTLTVPR